MHATQFEINFITQHPNEFEPVQTGTPGKSAVWDAQMWIDATVSDFQQFDVIVLSDTGSSLQGPDWAAALASRAIWGSAVNGNIFITSGDPINDGARRVFRQGLRFTAAQAGNTHGRTGLYVALDHLRTGEQLNGTTIPTEIPILSWFGSFKSVQIGSGFVGNRLVTQNPALNVLGANIGNYSGSTGQGFHSWPAPFAPIAYRISDPNPTPLNAPFYFAPCEDDTGYKFCPGQRPLVYMLAKAVNMSDLTRLVAAQGNLAVNVGQSCGFTAYSTILGDLNVNNPSGPSTQVSWRVVSGPNAGRHGKCTRQTTPPYGIPTGIWTASYSYQPLVYDPNNFQDVVQLFLDYDGDEVFDDLANNNNSPTDPDDPAPGVTIEYGTTFTVNWGSPSPSVSIATIANATEGTGSSCNGSVRLTRSPLTSGALHVLLCLGGTATFGTGADGDYIITVGGLPVSVVSDEFVATIPAGLTTVDITVLPVDDTRTEGTETVHLSIQDVFDVEHTYVVGGIGFTDVSITDNDQPVVTVSSYVSGGEQNPSGAWIFDTGTAITEPLKVYFSIGGTASNEVDYLTALTSATSDFDPADNILLPSGIGRVTIQPTAVSPAGSGHHAAILNMTIFQDSRTEGTESATLTLLTHPSYKAGTSASGSINITDDDTPKIPANGYAITDIGDATAYTKTVTAALNNNSSPQITGNYITYGDPYYSPRAFRWSGGMFETIPPVPGMLPQHQMLGQAINDAGWVVGTGFGYNYGYYYYLWDGANTIQLQTPSYALLEYGPRAINDANWIVGSAKNAQFSTYRAMRWDPSGNFVDFGGLNSAPQFSSFAWALSSSATGHRIVGESRIEILNGSVETAAFHGFRTQVGTEPQQIVPADDLGNALASETSSSGAYAVNSLFEIAGYSAASATERRAAYKDGNARKNLGWRTLGVLSGGSGAGHSSQALGVNDVGLIVGWSRTTTTGTGNPKAVVWENYQSPGATDLNLKIPVADRPSWLLQFATGINSSGKIVGYGLKNGSQRAFLLTPIP